MVNHPEEEVRQLVKSYLNKEKEFILPASNHEDVRGHRIKMRAVPTSDDNLLEMALCELHHNTGVHVNWAHPDNKSHHSRKQLVSDNTKANKPIVKGLDDDQDYEIIN